jgi:hypothetical protein
MLMQILITKNDNVAVHTAETELWKSDCMVQWPHLRFDAVL